jgi:hypothetical protein
MNDSLDYQVGCFLFVEIIVANQLYSDYLFINHIEHQIGSSQ